MQFSTNDAVRVLQLPCKRLHAVVLLPEKGDAHVVFDLDLVIVQGCGRQLRNLQAWQLRFIFNPHIYVAVASKKLSEYHQPEQ